jgi:hypothetical protein
MLWRSMLFLFSFYHLFFSIFAFLMPFHNLLCFLHNRYLLLLPLCLLSQQLQVLLQEELVPSRIEVFLVLQSHVVRQRPFASIPLSALLDWAEKLSSNILRLSSAAFNVVFRSLGALCGRKHTLSVLYLSASWLRSVMTEVRRRLASWLSAKRRRYSR